LGQKVIVGYDKAANQYYIDRTASGNVDFEKGFAARRTAPRLSTKNNLGLILIVDHASIELFADKGLSVMTEIFFPDSDYSMFSVQSADQPTIHTIQLNRMKFINQDNTMAFH
jgi:fructan beta-fructosidase